MIQRAIFEHMIGSSPMPDDVTTGQAELGGVPVVTVETTGTTEPDKVIFYLHGGAYTLGTAALSAGLVSEFTRRLGVRAVSVDYRLAPEHPFPAAPDDVLTAYRALLAGGVRPENVTVVGESAGAGLVAGLLAALGGAGLPQPAGAVLISPWADLSVSGSTLKAKAAVDPSLTEAGLRRRAQDYLGSADPQAARVSPVFADLTGVAPLLIQVGSHEILLADALRLAERAGLDDVQVELQVWAGLPHVFPAYSALIDEAGEALDSAAAFITRQSIAS